MMFDFVTLDKIGIIFVLSRESLKPYDGLVSRCTKAIIERLLVEGGHANCPCERHGKC